MPTGSPGSSAPPNTPVRLTERQRRLLKETRNAVLATIGPDQQPQLTPNWFLWDGTSFLVGTGERTIKVRNIRRDPRVTLCIESPTLEAAYVQVVGRAEFVERDDLDLTLRLIAKYREEDDVMDHWESIREGHVLLRIEPLRWQWFDVSA